MRALVLSFLFLIGGYWLFVANVPPVEDGVTSSQESLNQQTVERYRFRVDPTAVIVGSSLSARFAGAVGTNCIYDLSIAGGSAFTGLQIVAQKRRKPRTVLIEINLLERPVDQRFAERPLPYRRFVPITWVENSPINRALSTLAERRRIDTVPPLVPVLQAPLMLQQERYEEPLTLEQLRQITANLRREIAILTRDGIAPVLFEVPVHPSLMSKVRIRQIRDLISRAFADVPFIPSDTLADGQSVVTTDGVHLQEAEARRVLGRLAGISGIDCPGGRIP